MNETRMLSEYLAGLGYGDIPTEVIYKAKKLLLDYLGYSMAAVGEPTAEILVEFVKQFGKASEESTVIGYGFKTHPVNAALVNGAMGHIREMDDTDTSTMSHPGDSIIAAGLAVAEKEGVTGKDLLTAIVAGYEAALRIGAGVMPSHYEKGWHPTGTFCTFGAATSAGKILSFDAAQIENTLGLAGVQISGMFGPGILGHSQSREIFMTKDLRAGKAAMNGVMAALLTQMGFTGNPGILETDRGFCALYSDYYDLTKVVEGLGEEFKILKVSHKPYSACRYIHGAIDATLELVDKYGIAKNNVDRITVTGYKYIALGMDNPDPKGFYGPRFSMQFQVALASLEGREGLRKNMIDRHYGPQKLTDPQMRELMKRIMIVYDKDLDKEWPRHWTTIVQLETTDGKVHTCRVDLPKGEPENDITDEELNDKVRGLASQVIGASQAERMIDIIYRLEEIQNVRELTKLLIS